MSPATPRRARRGVPARLGGSVDRRAHRRARRLRQRAAAAAARSAGISPHAPRRSSATATTRRFSRWLTLQCGIVAFHGPMLEGRLARGAAGYDRDTFTRVSAARRAGRRDCASAARSRCAPGEAGGHAARRHADAARWRRSARRTRSIRPTGACCSSTRSASGPYRLDRMLTQLRLSGLLGAGVGRRLRRAAAMRRARTATPTARAVVAEAAWRAFAGPVLFGLPSGHTDGADADAAVRRPGARRRRRRGPR